MFSSSLAALALTLAPQYWPNKFVLFSWIASENATAPVDIFYGKYDDNVGGFQVRKPRVGGGGGGGAAKRTRPCTAEPSWCSSRVLFDTRHLTFQTSLRVCAHVPPAAESHSMRHHLWHGRPHVSALYRVGH